MPARAVDTEPTGSDQPTIASGDVQIVVEIAEDEDDDGGSGAAHWCFVTDAEDAVSRAAAALAATPGADRSGRAAQQGALAVTVALSTDAAVRALNAGWRGKDKPTNVLSFPAPDGARDDQGRRFLGDIVLAAETVRREAEALDVPPRHHLQHLVVHGILHLLGHDHESDTDAEAMEALEIEILARLGIANPYLDPLAD